MIANKWLVFSGFLAAGCAADTTSVVDLRAGAIITPLEPRLPIVMVAGMLQDEETVAPLAKALRDRGFDVTVWVPPNSGFDDIRGYAQQLAAAVDGVRRRTEAAQVDLIGHSEGGLTARRFVKDQLHAAPVHTLISLGSPQQGTDAGALNDLLRATGIEVWMPALEQMISGSGFLAELNAEDATPGDVRYVTVGTREDIVVQPVQHAAIPGAENLIVQEVCPKRAVGHFGMFEDGWVLQVVSAVLAGEAASGDCDAQPIGSGI